MTILLYTFSDKLFCNKPNQVDLSRRKGPKVCVVIDTMGVISLIALSILGGIGYLHVSTGAFWGIVGGSAALSLELVIYGIVLLTQKKKTKKILLSLLMKIQQTILILQINILKLIFRKKNPLLQITLKQLRIRSI